MGNTLNLFVHGDPKPKGSKRAFVVKGKPVLVESNKRVWEWQHWVRQQILIHRLHETYEGPVSVSLVFCFRRPKSAKKRHYPHVKPDIDKLCRTVLDALVGADAILDDAQVVYLVAKKKYDDTPGCAIHVERLDG